MPSAVRSSIAAVGSNVHIIWDDERNGAFHSTIQYSLSCDNGLSWSDEETVGDTLDLDLGASVAASKSRTHIAWSSYRNTATDTARVFYRSGSRSPTSVNLLRDTIANDGVGLGQNYPNPFNNQTIVQYNIAHKMQIRLSVYDILGRELLLLRNGVEQPGTYIFILDGQYLASGTYLLVLQTAGRKEVRRTLLVK